MTKTEEIKKLKKEIKELKIDIDKRENAKWYDMMFDIKQRGKQKRIKDELIATLNSGQIENMVYKLSEIKFAIKNCSIICENKDKEETYTHKTMALANIKKTLNL